MSLSIYHGDEDWILRGFGIDIEKSFKFLYPSYSVQRFESFTGKPGNSLYHLFVQQGQLQAFVKKNGTSFLHSTICIFTHFDVKQFPLGILNQCLAVFFMSSSQLSIAVANGLDFDRCYVVPLGVDQSFHKIMDESSVLKLQSKNSYLSSLSGRNSIGFCLRYWDKPAYTRRKRYDLVMNVVDILSNSLDLPTIILGPGWENCSFKLRGRNIIYINAKYKDYPYFYNMMKIFCSLSLHEGGPMPLLESLSCGVAPVVTNTGFSFDVLSHCGRYPSLSVDASIDKVISSILVAYNRPVDPFFNRSLAEPFSFHSFSRRVMSIID